MKILVTGGAGFIGRNVVDSFLKKHEITIYDNLSNSSEQNITSLIEKGVDFVKGDILDYDALVESCKEFDVVIHLAAKSDVSDSVIHPEITKKVNVDGTVNVVQCCIQNKIRKIIFASSASVYGDCNDTITEKTLTNPLSPYGSSKLDAENIIKKVSQKNELDYIIFRMFNVYGKGQNKQYVGVITKFLENITEKKSITIYGDGKQTKDYISIHDVVDAFSMAIKLNKTGTYNIASGKSISVNELSELMFNIFGKVDVKYLEKQKGDIQNSITDVSLAKNELSFTAKKTLRDELQEL
ncbi:MAG: NAD-dependent epimerase/dehydratase family protein [Nitrosopumilus sp.]|nr:NAD-dependent epimerase/dehydratase family protein [Nitrosopumilus sp.]NRA04605.1 NAD-dependent epimerase/dehydratase family protein [Nitrosopumilus sp.]